ncbi:hypothetical protein CROQUDRAFT_25292, partial [Cronartium quercuum f. sp. fusiforme G11]
NKWYVCSCGQEAVVMWKALCLAHEDSSSGGHLYLLHKLVTKKLVGDNILAHLDEMHWIFKCLNSLISNENPLTANDVFTTALFVSLSSDWLPVITPLMQHAPIMSLMVIQALKS